MSVSRVLLVLAAAGCHCVRSIPPGRNGVRLVNIHKDLVRSRNALVPARLGAGGGVSRIGVLSPRPDVIGPRDMARLTAPTVPHAPPAPLPGARRIYELELDAAYEYYDAFNRLENTDKPSSPNKAMRYNPYMRARSMRSTSAPSATPSTLFTTRSSSTPRTQPCSPPPELPGYASQNALRLKSKALVGYDVPLMDNVAPPQELDLPIFDDPANLAAAAEPVEPADKNNFSEATARTDKPGPETRTTPGPSFRLDSGWSGPAASEAPKKQRFENFVKFIQANKDLVEEYIKKKRSTYNAPSRADRALGKNQALRTWSVHPVGKSSPIPAHWHLTPRQPMWKRPSTTTTTTTTTTTKPRTTVTKSRLPITQPSPVSRQGMDAYITTGDPRLLDMAPARGGPIASMRLKGRICQRHVLLPEGPKYDKRGSVYLAAFQSIYDKDFPQTRAPRVLLPVCCNCCRKSVLGCE